MEEQAKNIVVVICCCISEFLLVAINSIGLDHCEGVVQPFIDRIYQVALDKLVKTEKIKGNHFIGNISQRAVLLIPR